MVLRGEQADAMYFIVAGEVEVELHPEPKRLSVGDYFGEISLLKRSPRTATVVSLTECRLLVLDAVDFEKLLKTNPELAEPLRATMMSRLQELEQSHGSS
jgi:voltage-gated potassium channel